MFYAIRLENNVKINTAFSLALVMNANSVPITTRTFWLGLPLHYFNKPLLVLVRRRCYKLPPQLREAHDESVVNIRWTLGPQPKPPFPHSRLAVFTSYFNYALWVPLVALDNYRSYDESR